MVPQSPTGIEPIPSIEGRPVYTASGNRLGEAVDLCVDLDDDRVTALLVSVEDPPEGMEVGPRGIRVPFRSVRGMADIIVLTGDPGIEAAD
ncbi:photosystem reaction center subunit H [Haloferax sp. Atlit-6N]|uniref:PRC domain protein n=2 Tax=Haloferax gibbonsii TaxID=35746 RepID=A0A871BIM4_HALGI|nr:MULTISPECIES: PRC-barrel domain-containing protein [Haloferax]ELZ80046.1 PRC-barrel domain-containing protein [Haloferax gibbonsii ATCC 33959]QOS12862.1 PRC domain protein [Haloferax gibbonsii]RDZ48325.1 photosystem reaction center subunit H [Haloferax sp. Atlit-19N]RDZ52813.1 photosystem reaction center subunit H [Haloferax sp. Atlit-4N]REA02139.1 photosystem reaction center subunit H [Haloferax sp. Atlit-6N]